MIAKHCPKESRAWVARGIKETIRKLYKSRLFLSNSNLRIVNMLPGDREVAGCFYTLSGGCW